MGIPQNFSLDIPRRCQMLIEDLWPDVSKHKAGSLPLNASFLLAISIPMVNLPIERIWKPEVGRAVGHLNDSVLDKHLAAAIRKDIGHDAVANAAFYQPGAWRYHYLPKAAGFPNLSQHGLPQAIEAALAVDAACQAAEVLSTETFCSILRNGLAHGGILYLDQTGRSTQSVPVRMFCFVSTKQTRGRGVEGLHFLRVGMREYRTFLKRWTSWLRNSATLTQATAHLVTTA